MTPRKNDKRRAAIYVERAFHVRRARAVGAGAHRGAALIGQAAGNPIAFMVGAIAGAIAAFAGTGKSWREI